jgi:hypothetical protein
MTEPTTMYVLEHGREGYYFRSIPVRVTAKQVLPPKRASYQARIPRHAVENATAPAAYVSTRYAFDPGKLITALLDRSAERLERAHADLERAKESRRDAMALAELHAAGRIPTIHTESEQ